MQTPSGMDLRGWVEFLGRADIPVLKQTARELEALRQDANSLSARSVAAVIARDPMMTAKLLRYLQQHKHRSQTSEVVQVEQALLMLGVEASYAKIPARPLVQDVLQGQTESLLHLMQVIHRSHRASEYAFDWAVLLSDLHFEEVRIAALLHDLAEMLVWCFAPQQMLRIRSMQQQDKALRSRDVQQQVLGFALAELQKALIREWELPALLLTLMDDYNATQPRVRNVLLAVNLARHSANGWDDAALPDDYRDIGGLLRMPAEEVRLMVSADAAIPGSATH